jgi:hypothetical protein
MYKLKYFLFISYRFNLLDERVLKKKPKLETDSEDVSAGSKFNQEGKATQRKKKKRKMSSPLEFESGPSGSKIYGSNIPKTFSVSTHVESCPIKSKQEFSSSLLAKKEKNQNDKVVTNKKPVKVSDSLVTTHQGILPNLHKKPKKNEGIMDANTCHSQQTKKTKKKLQLPMQDKKEFIQGCGRIMRDRLLAENFDLPIPLLSCNNSANNISELISKLKKSVLSVPTNRTLSQQVFLILILLVTNVKFAGI